MMEFIKKNYFIIFIIFSGLPLFFIPNAWDGVIFDYGLTIGNLSGIESFYKEIGSPIQLFFFYLVYFFQKIISVPHEFLFDLFTVIILLLFSLEIKKFSIIVFKLDNRWANLCASLAITFPIWDSLVSINLGLYLFCFYLVLLGYRLFISEKSFKKIIGIIIILISFSIKSNFSFIIGLSLAHNFRLFFDNQEIKKNSFIFILFLSIFSYFIDVIFFPPYGMFDGYNQVILKHLDFFTLLKNIYNYSTFFIFYFWIPIIYLIILKIREKHINFLYLFKKDELVSYFTIIIIFSFAVIPYLLINKSNDLFYFTDYESRHSYLLTLSFCLFFTILIKRINEIYNIKKINILILTFFIAQNLFLLAASYYTKVETTLFRHNFVEQLKSMETPPGGNVQIISNNIPGHLRPFEVSHLFFKAYEKASWWGTVIGDKEIKKNTEPEERILNRDDYRVRSLLTDYNQRCNIIVEFKNEIDKFDRISKLYILNSGKYFKIKLFNITC